jgi:hypothetical protein
MMGTLGRERVEEIFTGEEGWVGIGRWGVDMYLRLVFGFWAWLFTFFGGFIAVLFGFGFPFPWCDDR